MWPKLIGIELRIIPLVLAIIGVVSFVLLLRFPPESQQWLLVLKTLVGIGLASLFVPLFIAGPVVVYRRDTEPLKPLKDYRDSQIGHEGDYLRLCVESIALSGGGGGDVFTLRFQIDSGLVYDFQPHRIWVTVNVDGAEPNEPWEYRRPLNLLAGKRSQLGTQILPIVGDRFKEAIENARQGSVARVSVQVRIELRQGEEPIYLAANMRAYAAMS